MSKGNVSESTQRGVKGLGVPPHALIFERALFDALSALRGHLFEGPLPQFEETQVREAIAEMENYILRYRGVIGYSLARSILSSPDSRE